MIEGIVDETGAVLVPLTVNGIEPNAIVQALLDTVFNGTLTLPKAILAAMHAVQSGVAKSILADGSMIHLRTFFVDVGWHEGLQTIEVQESEGPILLGMNLLGGSRLIVDAVPHGRVEITPLE